MKQPSDIQALLDDRPASELIALLPPGSEAPGVTDALALLDESELGVLAAEPVAPEQPEARWEIEVELSVPGRVEPAIAHLWLEPTPKELLDHEIEWRGVTGADLEEGRDSRWAIGSRLPFAERALSDLHAQARLLAALARDALLVLDLNALVPRAGHWLREVAAARTPPSPTTLFSIHDVGERDAGPHWLHTHGLDRCGVIELDALNVPGKDAGLVVQLLSSVATLFLEQGIPEPDEVFQAGQDIDLVWLPWQDGAKKARRSSPGGRADRDDAHRGARGVLFARRRGLLRQKYESPAVYVTLLQQNPVLYVSSAETERMALLASERLPRFFALFDRFGSEERWMFLVKLGYRVDAPTSAEDREHLWFRVHAHDRGEVDATLLNAPYAIRRLREGDRARHSLELLSDWTILCKAGRFDADTVRELERAIEHEQRVH